MPIYMNIDPSLLGESRAENYPSWHEVMSFSWGCNHSSDRAIPSEVMINLPMDRSASGLMLACCQGRHFDRAIIAMTTGAGAEVMRFTLENVFISSYQIGGSGDEGRPTESLSLNFTKITFKDVWQDATGAPHTESHYFDFPTQTGK